MKDFLPLLIAGTATILIGPQLIGMLGIPSAAGFGLDDIALAAMFALAGILVFNLF